MSLGLPANRTMLQAEMAQRATVIRALPTNYHIHLNEPCNQRCIMCVPDGRHGKNQLTLEQVRRLLNQIEPYAEHITLIGGEPLLYPWIAETLELLSQRSVAVSINTNITRLDEEMAQRLFRLHELYLRCSIDASSRETYRRIRGSDRFLQVTDSLSRFAQMARDQPQVHLLLNYVVMRENLHEVLPFLEFARTLHPFRVEFHPVRHVRKWRVENGTGWIFEGEKQSCEAFRDEYNEIMSLAASQCQAWGLGHEVVLL